MRSAPLMVLALAACLEVDDGRPWSYDGPVNSCRDDGDCPRGACRRDVGRCVEPPPDAGTALWVRVAPEADSGAPAQATRIVLGAGGAAGAIAVARPVTARGPALAGDEALEAMVIFIDRGNQLPGRAAPRTVYRSRDRSFEFDLLPSAYDVVVLPEGAQAATFPPLYLDGVLLDEDGRLLFLEDPAADVELILERPEVTVEGQVSMGGQPVNGLTIRAVESGGGRAVSTAAVTACEQGNGAVTCGRFSIGLTPGVSSFSLRVSRPEEGHHPEILIPGFEVAVEAEGGIVDLGADQRLSLPALGPPLRYVATVERLVETADGRQFVDPAPGCFVRFLGEDIGGGRVERWVTTNESGTVEESEGIPGVNLYPGDYLVSAVPTEALVGSLADYSPFTSPAPISIVGSGEIAGQVFSLPGRPLHEGLIHVAGEGVPKAALSADPLPGTAALPRPSSGSSGFDGRYSLRLDPAEYLLTVEAPQESGYAWRLARIETTGDAALDLELPLPFAAEARLDRGADEAAPAGALVEFFFEIDGLAVLAGRAVAGAEGDVLALLPPPGVAGAPPGSTPRSAP